MNLNPTPLTTHHCYHRLEHANRLFQMYSGDPVRVKLRFHKRLANVAIDRFGKDATMHPSDENHFTVNVDVRVSGPFLGWIMSLGEGVKILSPDEVVEQMKKEIERLTNGGKNFCFIIVCL